MEAICIVHYKHQEKERQQSKKPARFFEFYGVWFAGELKALVTEVARVRFKADLGGRMHVFIDTGEVEKGKPVLPDGVHDIEVYGHACKLYKWVAQGYHRGLVVPADDDKAVARAQIYYESKTWSWQLSGSDRGRLAVLDRSER